MCSWNIGGVKDKLLNADIFGFLIKNYILWLYETKRATQISVPFLSLTIIHQGLVVTEMVWHYL